MQLKLAGLAERSQNSQSFREASSKSGVLTRSNAPPYFAATGHLSYVSRPIVRSLGSGVGAARLHARRTRRRSISPASLFGSGRPVATYIGVRALPCRGPVRVGICD